MTMLKPKEMAERLGVTVRTCYNKPWKEVKVGGYYDNVKAERNG